MWRSSGMAGSSAASAGKSQKQVKKLIAGPGVFICGGGIDLCNDITATGAEMAETLKQVHAAMAETFKYKLVQYDR